MKKWGGAEAEARVGVAVSCVHISPLFCALSTSRAGALSSQPGWPTSAVKSQLKEQFSSLHLPLRPLVRFPAELGQSFILALEISIMLGRASVGSHHAHFSRFSPQHSSALISEKRGHWKGAGQGHTALGDNLKSVRPQGPDITSLVCSEMLERV